MKLGDIYGGAGNTSPGADTVNPGGSPAASTAPTVPVAATNNVAISWVGILIVLILLRIVYELSE